MASTDSAYDPFRRHDRYGTAGATPQPLSEKLLLAALTVLVLPLKVIGAFSCLLCFYAFCRASIIIPQQYRSNAVARAGKIACRLCLFCLGFVSIKWEKVAAPDASESAAEPCVLVSNHCSWIDILVHMSRFFPAFVARDSTKHMMLVGVISQRMGCVFVDRERQASSSQGVGSIVKERITDAANGSSSRQQPMLLFPEGTTTNGQFLLPFKSGAFLAGCPVHPIVLKYRQGRVSLAWESIPAAKHIWLVLCIPCHSVTAVELPVYQPSQEEINDPVLYAKNVRRYMLKYSGLGSSNSTLADKREFHSLLRGEQPVVVKKAN